jgi:hypothetical protein
MPTPPGVGIDAFQSDASELAVIEPYVMRTPHAETAAAGR